MEHSTHPVSNATADASNLAGGDQPIPFTWQNAAFPMPSPRARPSGSDRISGVVHSNRPRWTPAKHARILAQIKATRTDIDPSFPRDKPESQPPVRPAEEYRLTDVIGNVAQRTKSFFDSLTEYALEQYHGVKPIDPKRAKLVGEALQIGTKANEAEITEQKKAQFVAALHQLGLSKDEATDVVLLWTARGIPLNVYTVPKYINQPVLFTPWNLFRSGVSEAAVIDVEWGGEELILKSYREFPTVPERLQFLKRFKFTFDNPRWELRNLLASHIAHNVFDWNITPKISLAFIGGRICIVSPRIKDRISFAALGRNRLKQQIQYASCEEGTVLRLDKLGDDFSTEFKDDYIRLQLLSIVIGDHDRHSNNFLISVEGEKVLSITGIDWDLSFGSVVQFEDCILPGRYNANWIEPIPQKICDEYNKVTEENLHEVVSDFGLSQEEIDSVIHRFLQVKEKLSTVRKT